MSSGLPFRQFLANPVLVGRFGAAHGVRGEVRLQSFTQDPKAIGRYGPLTGADGRCFKLTSVRLVKDAMLVVRVEGIADRAAAEALTNLDLSIDRSMLPPPDDEEFYVADLIGLAAVTEAGDVLGTIVDMPNYGGGDLIEVRPTSGGETLLYPFTKAVVPTVDLAARRVTIVPPVEVGDESDDAD
jgi:16S rRNA processing protein RimM